MAERKKIGIVFWGYDKNWIAGTYYLINIIKGLSLINDKQKPLLYILTHKEEDYLKLKNETDYPLIEHLSYPHLNFLQRAINKAFRSITKGRYSFFIGNLKEIDFFFYDPILFSKRNKSIFWIPDFQEYYLPYMFSKEEILFRKKKKERLSQSSHTVIFSSQDSTNDYLKFYPDNKNLILTIPFAVFHPQFEHLIASDILSKYNITKPYFIVPNQFWKHKNHITVLKSLLFLRNENFNINFQIVFTVNTSDYRNKDHFQNIIEYINSHSLAEHVKFLGFIEQTEMLCLTKNSIAVIQPSLFEGWSTVVEDAKALNVPIILSAINVHKEQTKSYPCHYFKKESEQELSQIIKSFIQANPCNIYFDYSQERLKFSERLKQLFEIEN